MEPGKLRELNYRAPNIDRKVDSRPRPTKNVLETISIRGPFQGGELVEILVGLRSNPPKCT